MEQYIYLTFYRYNEPVGSDNYDMNGLLYIGPSAAFLNTIHNKCTTGMTYTKTGVTHLQPKLEPIGSEFATSLLFNGSQISKLRGFGDILVG